MEEIMKGLAFIAVLSFLFVLGIVNSYAGSVFDTIVSNAEVKEGVKEITYEQFTEIRNSGEKYVLLDTLSPESFTKGHIEGAESFSLTNINAESAAEKLSKDANIIVYCGSFKCRASTEAAKILSGLGYNVLDYKGGLMEWEQKGNQLVK